MSESTFQSMLQSELQSLDSTFQPGSVVINDWTVLDGPTVKAPFVIIENSDSVDVGSLQTFSATTWVLPFTLVVAFVNWEESLNQFRDARQAILDHLINLESYDNNNGKLAVDLRGLRAASGILSIYSRYVQEVEESLPTFLSQDFQLTLSEPI